MSRPVPLRVRASNAIVAIVDFSASAMAAAEGEISQKDAVLAQLTERLAQLTERLAELEAKEKAYVAEAIGLADKVQKASEEAAELRATLEAERLAPAILPVWEDNARAAIAALLRERDSMKRVEDGSQIERLDARMNVLRSLL